MQIPKHGCKVFKLPWTYSDATYTYLITDVKQQDHATHKTIKYRKQYLMYTKHY